MSHVVGRNAVLPWSTIIGCVGWLVVDGGTIVGRSVTERKTQIKLLFLYNACIKIVTK